MGRLLSGVYVIKGVLRAQTPIHIGSAAVDLVADMPLARDGRGRCHIPATSLAGPIRRWWQRRAFDVFSEETLFGRTPPGEREGEEGHASYLIIDDAPVNDATAPETRDGVGIDRETGAAAEGIKYDREVLPVGTTFTFRMEVQVPDAAQIDAFERERENKRKRSGLPPGTAPKLTFSQDQVEQALGVLILALENGRIRFGAAKTRGLGRLVLECTHVAKREIGERAGLMALLRKEVLPNRRDALVKDGDDARDEIEIVVRWTPTLPVMNKSDVEGVSVDALPLVTAVGDKLQPVITGASLKGALRSHGERVCRTLAGAKPWADIKGADSPATQFLKDLVEPAVELVGALFGSRGISAEDDERYGSSKDAPAMPGLGALAIDDCLISEPISRDLWEALLVEAPKASKGNAMSNEHKTAAIRKLLEQPSRDGKHNAWKDYRPSTHVAIDRWTGGAADGLLFSRLEPSLGGPPREFRLWLDPARLARPLDQRGKPLAVSDEQFRHAAVALLVVLLRELVRGRIPIGFGATRGLGSIAVERITITLPSGRHGDALKELMPSGEITPDEGISLVEKFAVFEKLQQPWQDYWNAFRRRAAA